MATCNQLTSLPFEGLNSFVIVLVVISKLSFFRSLKTRNKYSLYTFAVYWIRCFSLKSLHIKPAVHWSRSLTHAQAIHLTMEHHRNNLVSSHGTPVCDHYKKTLNSLPTICGVLPLAS